MARKTLVPTQAAASDPITEMSADAAKAPIDK